MGAADAPEGPRPAARRGVVPDDQDDEGRQCEDGAERAAPEADVFLDLRAPSPGHVEPITRLYLERNHLRAYGQGAQVDHRANAVADELNPAGIGRTTPDGYIDVGTKNWPGFWTAPVTLTLILVVTSTTGSE